MLELAMEGRRRVKEQLKKRGSFEFYKTDFSCIDEEPTDERQSSAFRNKADQGRSRQDPLPPGTVYTAVRPTAKARLASSAWRSRLTAGTGKVRTPTGLEKGMKESLDRAACSLLQSTKERKLGLRPVWRQKDIVCRGRRSLRRRRIECGLRRRVLCRHDVGDPGGSRRFRPAPSYLAT